MTSMRLQTKRHQTRAATSGRERRFSGMEQSHLIGSKALIVNAALRPFAFLIGEWRTTGTHPLVPGRKLSGRTSFSWHEGGEFLIMRSQVDEPNFPDGVANIGTDEANSSYAMVYFD